MQIGDKVKANWKRVYPTMTGEIVSIDSTIATVLTPLGKIDFPLTSLKKI
jgi:hypothetical protein